MFERNKIPESRSLDKTIDIKMFSRIKILKSRFLHEINKMFETKYETNYLNQDV